MVLISKTDSIPTKKIVSVLGNIAIKKTYSESEASAMKALSNKAKMAGANAIVNFFFRGKGFSCTGLAVIVEDIEPVKQEMKPNFVNCSYCGNQIKEDNRFCVFCGSKQ